MITIHQRYRQTDRQTDGRTDRQTTCDRNTALCTKVHRAVKMYKCVYKAQNAQSTKIAKRVGEYTCSGTDYKTKVAMAGSWAGGGGVLKKLEQTTIDKRIFIKIEICVREGKVVATLSRKLSSWPCC